MMKAFYGLTILLLAAPLLGAAPAHVQTADYWAGYAGTKTVPPQEAARALTWVETDAAGSSRIRPYGVKTIMYSNPNRAEPGSTVYGSDEAEYAHNCAGARVRGSRSRPNEVMTDPHSDRLAQEWRESVARHEIGTHFDAIFDDEAVGAAYAIDQPCNYDLDDWIRGEISLQRALGSPVIYNGLSDFRDRGIAPEIALNATAIGGMEEECYATLRGNHRQDGWRWIASEATEIRMAQERKYFFCYGRDLTPADQADDSRMYTYASFLLTYDPATSVLWEYYKTPSNGHVMPESRLVALDPVVVHVRTVDQLRTPSGIYVRAYRRCYLGGRNAGPCISAVNPDDDAHPVDLRGYTRVLSLSGSGVFDGGSASIVNRTMPAQLDPQEAIIAFK